MYGADKIPDSWFEKVPGGFYKKREIEKKEKGKLDREKHGSGSRPSTSGSGSGRGGGGRDRRRSTGEATHRPPFGDDDYDERGRDDGRRRRQQNRSSYDGVDDDQYSGDDRHRRRNHGSSRRRRSFDDNDRQYDGGYGMPPREGRYEERRMPARPPYPQADFVPPQNPSPSYAHASPTGQQSQPAAVGKSGVENGYVPYAHIYGQPDAPLSNNGSAQPNGANQGARPMAPPHGYRQNPYAQQAPTAAAAGAGAAYTGHAGPYPNGDGYDPRFDRHRHERPDRGYSPSYDSRQDGGRSARSERRRYSPDDAQRTKSQGARGKSHVRETFDAPHRRLDYGAAGTATAL